MKIPAFTPNRMLKPTPKERLTAHPAVVLLLFLAVLTASELGRILLASAASFLIPHSANRSVQLLISLFATSATVGVVLLYCLAAERRSLTSLGLNRRGALSEYAFGLLGGLVLFGTAVLICGATDTLTVARENAPLPWGMLLLFLLGYLIQGMSEELLCRSYLMVSLSRGLPLWACAMLNALLFSLIHLGNPEVSFIALVNIFLFGLFASFLTLRRGSIWMVGGLHSMWNFSQGNLFGISVSGIAGSPSLLRTELTAGGWQGLLNGGAFGLEGGLAVTAVLLIACCIVVVMPTKKTEIPSSNSELPS